MKKQKQIEMEAVAGVAESSEKEMWDRGLRILARIIARRHLENTRYRHISPEGGDPLGDGTT